MGFNEPKSSVIKYIIFITNKRGIARITAIGEINKFNTVNKVPTIVIAGKRGTIRILESGVIKEKLLKLNIKSGNVASCAANVIARVSRNKNLSGTRLKTRM